MKIIILANSDGGLYSFRNELVQRLLQEHELIISVPRGNYFDYFTGLGCRVEPTTLNRHGTNPFQELDLLRAYTALLKREKPDIVFTYTIKPNVYGGMAAARLGVPCVANITGLGTAVENGGFMQKLTLSLYKLGLKKARMVFFQNRTNEEFLVSKGVVRGQHMLIPGSGVNLDKYTLFPYPEGDTVNFLFAARIMKEKGIEEYLKAAEAIRAVHPETRFHICGACEQNYKERLTELEERGIIIYHGRVSNMPDYYAMAACTVLPTFYPEGMNNVLLESCASGRPIITTDRPGCGEIVDDGINGFVVRPQDSADLIEKIERFLSLPWEERRALGLAGRQKVAEQFDRNVVIRRYLEEIEKVK